LPLADWKKFASLWHIHEMGRKQMMTRQGESERYAYFVLEGLQRAFYTDDRGKEHTVVFTYPHSFSGVADSFLLGKPALYDMETLTKSKFLRADRAAVLDLCQSNPEILKLIHHATSIALRGAVQRQIELMACTAKEKFKLIMGRSPHLLNLSPQKYIASYLGMDPATFSKLISRVEF
jgi:CRP-like cAMP-binding protein